MKDSWRDFLAKQSSKGGCFEQGVCTNYGDLISEALFTGASVTDLSHFGLLKVEGPGSKDFLQGQLSCQMEEISEKQSRLAVQCTPKGRVLSCMRVIALENGYGLFMPRELINPTLDALQKYAAFYKCDLKDSSNDCIFLGLRGDEFTDFPQETNTQAMQQKQIIIRLHGESPRYLILTDMQTAKEYFSILVPLGSNAWALQEIRTGVPWVTLQTREKFTPHDINYPELGGVNFNKGCYTGQEIIARMEYLGKLKQHARHLTVKATYLPIIGTSLHTYNDDKKAGVVINSALSDYDTYEALVTMSDKYLETDLVMGPDRFPVLCVIS